MFKFGFELEGFYVREGEPSIPPEEYPTDSFPGLVELRTKGGRDILAAYAEIFQTSLKYPFVDFKRTEFVFEPKQRGELRRRYQYKDATDIRNIYDKSPRLLGNRTLASLQINVSCVLRDEYWDKDRNHHPTVYGLFDIPRIITALDKEFAAEIKAAKRQPGEYAIKDDIRLEYRSLPNSIFEFNMGKARGFINRIENAVKG